VAKLQVMKSPPAPTITNTVTCPACGMLCDDIFVTSISPLKISNGCSKSVAFFEQTITNVQPQVAGKTVALSSAIQRAAEILQQSQQPFFAGLGTEVHGMRAVLNLAEKVGATLDHMHSEASIRNTLALQNSGWQTTTLTEIKNRADLIIAIGTDIVSSHPRFLEKLVQNEQSLFNKAKPEVQYLGADTPEDLPEILNVLNALANNKKVRVEQVNGVTIATLAGLLEKIKAAHYAVLVWSASKLDFPHAELTIQSITRLISKLNETTRVAGLPLNSGDGDTSVSNTCTWRTGYTANIRFISKTSLNEGIADYKPYSISANQSLLHSDALLWISTFNATPPPTSNLDVDVRTIVIGHPNMRFTTQPEVFIPVGIPGLDHTGIMFRLDSAVSLPLKKVRNSGLPTLADVLRQIEAALC
jgi:formylmethanofuran dehydrogenase subunit B